MMCAEAQRLLHAYLDRELGLTDSLAVEDHMEGCQECAASYKRFELLRAEIAGPGLGSSVPDATLERLRGSIERRAGLQKERWWTSGWQMPALLAAVAAVAVISLSLPARFTSGGDSRDRAIVDSHLRSLLAGHLIDVASSDRHTVKPWFQGKIDFSPAVPDLSADGFVLSGGRLDVVDGRTLAVLVYKRREHIINVWISPAAASTAQSEPERKDVTGYHILRWSEKGMTYQAVSDLNPVELRVFADKLRTP